MSKSYRDKNPEKAKEYDRLYREKHKYDLEWKKKQREYNDNWIKRNPEKVRELKRKYAKSYAIRYPEKSKEYSKKFRELHPEKIKEWRKKYKKNHLNERQVWMEKIKSRDGTFCRICKTTGGDFPNDLTLNHIVPKVVGGDYSYENLEILCRSCNTKEYSRLALLAIKKLFKDTVDVKS